HAEQHHHFPVVPAAEPRGVAEEQREREQRRADPEQRAEHARREVGAVLELLGEVEPPERSKNAECGVRNAECHYRFRAPRLAPWLDLPLQFRTPHSPPPTCQPPTPPYRLIPRLHASQYPATHPPTPPTSPPTPCPTPAPSPAPTRPSTG